MAFNTLVVRSLLTATALLTTSHVFADDVPVEKPAVDRPALPQPDPASPAEPSRSGQSGGRSSSQSETPPQGQRAASSTGNNAQAGGGSARRFFPYLAVGPGALIGLSGGADFERTNPALSGALGLEIPIAPATGLGFELDGDVELAAAADRGTYTALLVRARLGRMLTPRNRVWGAVGVGGAGYESTSLAFGLAAGTSLMLVPKFGLDFSANLSLLGSSSSRVNGVQSDYPGGALVLIAVRALFELHR